MSENKGGGLLGGLILGAGLAGILLAPFYIAYRFGVQFVAGAFALIVSAIALFSDELIVMADEAQYCGHLCLAAPGARLILDLDKIGWGWIAGVAWFMFAMSILASNLNPKAEIMNK